MTEAGDPHNCLWPLGTTEPWPTGFAQLMGAAWDEGGVGEGFAQRTVAGRGGQGSRSGTHD